MGFNPELTGRQNAYYTAGLMGISIERIETLMPEIEAFAEIGEYFDQPLRVYSSGMQVRVAFAVATAVRPDILIVDEALSVGDTYFQHKSFARIREFQELGTTLLIVSHDRSAIQSLCSRAILLEQGSIIKDGNPEEVMDFYNALIAEKENSTLELNQTESGKVQTKSGTGEVVLEQVVLENSKGQVAEYIDVGETVTLKITAKVNVDVDQLVCGYGIKDRLGQVVYGTNTWHSQQVIENVKAGEFVIFEFQFAANLGVGSYSVQTAFVDTDTHLTANYEWIDHAYVFNTINASHLVFEGSAWLQPQIKITRQLKL
jgi:lipopolysaccharide transport system ATP-binding protein